MSGKPYSIHEFKMIVDYLVENKFYGETKARKMWVDFANTKLTTRTWQSLKETFLKRILPDIHNPYFHLTNEQISSFRSRCDLADRNKNKLDIQTISDDSSSNGPKDNEPSHNEGETTAGENITCSKVPVRSRSSADTVILENCYETAEEIQKDLESTESYEKPTGASKSLRDCITYSEPLTPMLQEVLDDFASEPEDSDREGQMEIVENVPEDIQEVPEPNNEILNTKSIATDVAKNAKGLSAEVVEEVLAQELDGSKPENKSPKKNNPNVKSDKEEIPLVNLVDDISSMQVENGTEKDDDADAETPEATKIVTAEVTEKPVAQNSVTPDVIVIHDSHSEPQVQSGGLNNSNSTVDASLPNNPEALTNKNSETAVVNNKEAPESEIEVTNNSDEIPSPKKATRKRSCSGDNSNTIDNKKKKLEVKLKSPSKTDNKVKESHLDMNGEDKLTTNEESIKPDVIKKTVLEDNSVDLNKPSKSYETRVADIMETEKRSNTKESPEIKNPCLQNISLFDEQFNKTNYTMSESSDTEQNKKESQVDKQEASVSKPSNDVVVLKSNSESDAGEVHASPKKKQRAGVLISKAEREKAIANMFGFTSGGGVGAKRKRQLSRRSRTVSHNNASHNNASHHTAALASNTSDWTSESEDFVSPPRSRKNRSTRKYLKPQAVKISALEEEGGLFVMYGKKIYPVIKDGKIVKNYITYLPESDSEEGETFWKQKYEEEKKKASELKKLLEEAKEPRQGKDTHSPIPQANPNRNSTRTSLAGEPSNGVAKDKCLSVPDEKKEEPKEIPPEKIKIKFTKNNEEVQLEGHWPQIHPVLEQVVHIFHKEIKSAVIPESSTTVIHPEQSKELSSGVSTPVIIPDPEVHEKVNEIEKEIFKEIEERDKEEEIEPNAQATNVTKRIMKPPPRKSSSSVHSPEEQPKTSNGAETKESEKNSRTRRQKAKETENNNTQENVSKRPTRTPRKILNETVNINESKTMQTRRSTQKLNSSVDNEDEEVRYMLPPKNNRQSSLKSPANKKTNQKKSSGKPSKIFSSPDTVSHNSMDSTQGYQDSDVSPVNTETKKKKKIDTSSFLIKTRKSLRRSTRRKSHPYLYHDAYNDSSNSSVDASVRVVTRENSSLNTDAYRSESYQLLNPRAKVSSTQLEPIDETTPIDNETYFVRHLESICRNEISAQINNNFTSPSCQMTSDVGSSSNVSLPMSPELSVVENMSVSKEMLNLVEDYPTIHEMRSNEIKEGTTTMCSKYNMISDVDISVPLMNQECEFESCDTVTEMSTDPKSLVTDSLLKNIGTFNINDQVTATDTINKKLHDLLLESAKKTTESQSALKEANMMDVDVTSVEVQKKPKATKKRCSTPQKRKASKKSVGPTVDPVVEEEHVEACSHSGRKSCPPLFQTNLCNDNVVTEEINMANLTIANEKPKGRKKKDIIRVKIQRPKNKNKKATEKLRTKSAQNASRISVFTDSGINDSVSEVFLPANDSVDLIHNHSETCLHANECVGDSIEFVENSLKSVITLGDSMQSGDNEWNSRCENNEEHSKSPDLFCNNAQDVSFYNRANSDINNTSDTVYHSPLGTEASPNSLLTEDLSDETPPPARSSKWYLFSEDETNTNLVGAGSIMLSSGSYGSNLKQLFPIACAVPDLSTITEMSRENDSSRKPNLEDLDGLTGDDFNTLSAFHSNF